VKADSSKRVSDVSTLFNDIKYALRRLRKKPGFTAIALITLAIGISANTVIFSMVNMLVYRPIQVKDPDRLVYCGMQGHPGFRYEEYTDIRDDNPAFSDLIAVGGNMGSRGTWLQGAVVKQMRIAYVSANYFSALRGISPMDPVSIIATVIVLAGTSLLAGYIPARRAVKIDPMEALRYE
jgi:ABC-type antimicrobial peptide transport system permease subunit